MTARPMTERAEMEPCPCCGERPILLDIKFGRTRAFYVTCKNDDCLLKTLQCDSPRRAIGIWNRRAPSAVRGMREALEKAAEQFEFYAREHRNKSLLDQTMSGSYLFKAQTNEDFAKMCRAALSLVEGEDKQATRGDDAATAPTTTDTKDTTK